jgi:hypothetical protein
MILPFFMVRIVKKKRRIIFDDLLPWIQQERKAQWFILCLVIVLVATGIWFLVKPSPKKAEAVAKPSVANTPASPSVSVRQNITIAGADTNTKPSAPTVPQPTQPTLVITKQEAPVVITKPQPPVYNDFPAERVIMRHMAPSAVWDPARKYFFDRRTGEHFITPPNVYLFNNRYMVWEKPFDAFANRYRGQGRIFRAQAPSSPPIYLNWRGIVDKYGERARLPAGR